MVINMRSVAGMAAIWVIAVAGVSATAWFAIDRAGRDITSASGSTRPLPPLSTPTRASQPLPTGAAPTAPTTPAPTAAAQPSAAATPHATRTTTWTSPASSASPPAAAASPIPAARPRPRPRLATVSRTIVVPGGQVTVQCTGTSIRLQVAQPENGWRVHVETSAAGRIVVSFRTGDEEEARVSQVTAVCVNGAPVFTGASG